MIWSLKTNNQIWTFSGRNSRLDTIQAAILRIKLKDYNKVLKVRNEYARIYFKLLSNIKNLTLLHLNNKNTLIELDKLPNK